MNINITILGQIISFVVFVLFCMKYLWPPIMSIIEKRQKEISDMFASSEESQKISEIKKIEAFKCLEKAKEEAKLIVLRADQRRIELISQAQYMAKIEREKILSQAYEEINNKKKCISEELQQEIASMILLGIERILEGAMNQCLNQDIINSVLNNLPNYNIGNINHKEL